MKYQHYYKVLIKVRHVELFQAKDFSGVHVLLVSLFGIPIVQSISHFFGRPKKALVDQKKVWYRKKKIWYTKMKFGRPKKKFGRPKKYLVYQKKFGIPKSTKSTWTSLLRLDLPNQDPLLCAC